MPKGKRALLGSNPPAISIPLTLESARGGSGTGVASLFQESLMARKTHAIRSASEFTGKHSVYTLDVAVPLRNYVTPPLPAVAAEKFFGSKETEIKKNS